MTRPRGQASQIYQCRSHGTNGGIGAPSSLRQASSISRGRPIRVSARVRVQPGLEYQYGERLVAIRVRVRVRVSVRWLCHTIARRFRV